MNEKNINNIIGRYRYLLTFIKELNKSGFGCRTYEMNTHVYASGIISRRQLPYILKLLLKNNIIYLKEGRRDRDRITGKKFKTDGKLFGEFFINKDYLDII